ncbi:glucuronyl hydrolase [Lentzea sp. NBRC 105346]|uniref:glycoside hydrolase family 88 protein n=1 Tax=Lentzea sp. NBRC 105346 TaxID=3032205 RepID=UPI0024A36325|nr:glycoside hydrolase family 88 protein [Lentzea sp. NBRC 105346]GLZ33820.1 glucuronyl hydrolase [Lentzea sp. NBRC 105346]
MNLSRRALLTATAITAVTPAIEVNAAPSVYRTALDYAITKLRATAPRITSFPEGTRFEKWTYVGDGGWVGGFWPGTLWLADLDSGDELFKILAVAANDRLAPRRLEPRDHDLGFLFYPSWVTAYRLTGDTKWRDGAIDAAATLIKRYNDKGRYIRAWGALGTPNNAGRTIIDTMMNLDLLAFATKETGDPKYLDVAIAHARTTQANFIRPDGSTPHVFDFNPDTGAPIGPNTVQGYSPTSCWSRGQAWGIYGFTTMYRRTRNREFLDSARKMADFALKALSSDHVPVWDYRSPLAPNDIKDATAGAIMACGLLDLATATSNPVYRTKAYRIVEALCRTCLTTNSTRAEAILARGTRNRPAEDGVEISLPYGDYYLIEALLRILKPQQIARAIGL